MNDAPRLDADWSWHGQPAVVVENRHLRVVLLPGLGGKIISLVDKRADLELLWRHPRIAPRPVPFGAGYDDHFLGGWDELYPNDEPEELAGEPFPDHGELWTLPWQVETGAGDGEVWAELTAGTPVSASLVTKRLRLGDDNRLRVDYAVSNVGPTAQPYLWKSHVALGLRPGSLVDLGAATMLLHPFGSPRARPVDGLVHWPELVADGVSHDLRRPPPAGGVSEFLIATSMREGFAELRHPDLGSGLRLEFDLADLPSCWTFASYGGWRGLEVLVLEPCTGFPLSVTDGVAAGTHRVLGPGETRRWTLTALVG